MQPPSTASVPQRRALARGPAWLRGGDGTPRRQGSTEQLQRLEVDVKRSRLDLESITEERFHLRNPTHN